MRNQDEGRELQQQPVPVTSSSSAAYCSSASHHHHHHHHHHARDDVHAQEQQEEERRHLMEVVLAFREYGKSMGKEVERRWQHLCKLPPSYARLLRPDSLAPVLATQRAAVLANQAFLDAVVQRAGEVAPADDVLARTSAMLQANAASPRLLATRANESKIRATLHSCMREWSEEGATERAVCFGKLLDALAEHLPVTPQNRHKQRVLVPGAGLGRLPLEIVARGYACQGNEFSYFMLLGSNFLLNGVESKTWSLFPFLDQTCNRVMTADNVQEISVPDVCAAELLEQACGEDKEGEEGEGQPDFSMTAGEFLQVYGDQAGCWDAVVTCFFLDTAPVVIEYVERIHSLLRPGGVWLNFGPLLYHWAAGEVGDQPDERFTRSVELSWEEVRHVMVEGFGFEMKQEEMVPGVTYSCNARSIMKTVFDCLFFAATKKEGAGEQKYVGRYR